MKQKVLIRVTVMLLQIVFLAGLLPVAYAAESARELFTNDALVNATVSAQSPSSVEVAVVDSSNQNFGKAIKFGLNGYGYTPKLELADGEVLNLEDRDAYSLFFKVYASNAPSNGKIRPAILASVGNNQSGPVGTADFINVKDYPKVTENDGSQWYYVTLGLDEFMNQARIYDANASVGMQDATCGSDQKFRLVDADFSKVSGIAMLCNAWTADGHLGPHYYTVYVDDVRFVKGKTPLTTAEATFYNDFGDELELPEDVGVNASIRLTFDSEVPEGLLASTNVYLEGASQTTRIQKDGADFLISFSHPLSYGTSYTLVIADTIRDILGNKLSESIRIPFGTRAEPSVLLEAPQGFYLEAVDYDSVVFGWEEVLYAESYDIYRNGIKVDSITACEYTDTGLAMGTEYEYAVRAVNRTEMILSEMSEEFVVETLSLSAPENLSAISVEEDNVLLVWDEYGQEIDGFRLFRNGVLVTEDLITDCYYLDSQVTVATDYRYELIVCHEGIESDAAVLQVRTPAADSERGRVIFSKGKYVDASSSGWGDAASTIDTARKGVDNQSASLAFTVPNYTGVKLHLSTAMNLSSLKTREETYLSFWVKRGKSNAPFKVVLLDNQANESCIKIDAAPEEWTYYSIPISMFCEQGVKYEGSSYKKKNFLWGNVTDIGIYGTNIAVDMLMDDIRLGKVVPKVESVFFYDEQGVFIPARNDAVPLHAKTAKISFNYPIRKESLQISLCQLVNGEEKPLVVAVDYDEKAYQAFVKLPNLKFGASYQLLIPDSIETIDSIGIIDETTRPDATLDDAAYCSGMEKMKLDTEQSSGRMKATEARIYEFGTEPIPIQVQSSDFEETENDILAKVVCKNVSKKPQEFCVVFAVYEMVGTTAHLTNIRIKNQTLFANEQKTIRTESLTVAENNMVTIMIFDNLSQAKRYYQNQIIR